MKKTSKNSPKNTNYQAKDGTEDNMKMIGESFPLQTKICNSARVWTQSFPNRRRLDLGHVNMIQDETGNSPNVKLAAKIQTQKLYEAEMWQEMPSVLSSLPNSEQHNQYMVKEMQQFSMPQVESRCFYSPTNSLMQKQNKKNENLHFKKSIQIASQKGFKPDRGNKAFERIIDCIQFSEKPLELKRASNQFYHSVETRQFKSRDVSTNFEMPSVIQSVRGLPSRHIQSMMSDRQSIVVPMQSTFSSDSREQEHSSETLLNQFRRVNKVVRKNKSSELRNRNFQDYKSLNNFYHYSNKLPSTQDSRAPKLTKKIAGIEMCKQLLEASNVFARIQQNLLEKSAIYKRKFASGNSSPCEAEKPTPKQIGIRHLKKSSDQVLPKLQSAFSGVVEDEQEHSGHHVIRRIELTVGDTTPHLSRLQHRYESGQKVERTILEKKNSAEFGLVKCCHFQTPIYRPPQVFMFDGVKKRKVILRDARQLSSRLEEF